jgi:hypothetical protein
MVKLVLDPQVVLSELETWRDATLMTRRRSVLRRDSEPRVAAARMAGAAERVEGLLMLLNACSTELPEDAGELEQLVAQLREFKAWVQQAQYAAQLLQTLSPPTARKRPQAHAR